MLLETTENIIRLYDNQNNPEWILGVYLKTKNFGIDGPGTYITYRYYSHSNMEFWDVHNYSNQAIKSIFIDGLKTKCDCELWS